MGGGSTHRIISARQDAFVCALPGQIKLEILRFQKRRRMGRSLASPSASASVLLRFKYECKVNSGNGTVEGGRTYADHGWVGL